MRILLPAVCCLVFDLLSHPVGAIDSPELPRVLTGQVVDADGSPVEGALVEWGYFNIAPEERESTATDANGRFRLETENVNRDYRLGVSKAGMAPWWQDNIVPGPASEPSEFNIALGAGSTLQVRAVDDKGRPMTGLMVTPQTPTNGFHSSFSSPTPETPLPGKDRVVKLADDGTAVLTDLFARPEKKEPVPSEPVTPQSLRALEINWLSLKFHDGEKWVHEASVTSTQAASGEEVLVKFPGYRVPKPPRPGVIRGRVVDRETGKVVASAKAVRRHTTELHPVNPDDGTFMLGQALTHGREYQTRVFAPGYAVAVVRIKAGAPKKAKQKLIKLDRHSSFQGRLVRAVSGQPIAGVQVVAGHAPEGRYHYVEWKSLDSYADGHHSLQNVLRVTTDEDGRFTVPEEPGKPVTLVVLTDGYERRIIAPAHRPEADEKGIVEIGLGRPASMTAIPLLETQLGAAANGVSIMYRSQDDFEHMYHSTPLDEDGRLTFDRLQPGEYMVTLYRDVGQFGFPSYSKSITLKAGEHQDVTLGDMLGTITLSGTTNPFSAVTINPTFEAEIRNFCVQANVDGRFELAGLFPGEYTVRVDISSASRGYHSDLPPQTIQVTEDMTINVGLPTVRKAPTSPE